LRMKAALKYLCLLCVGSFCFSTASADEKMSEKLKNSLVYVKISSYSYNQFQPWKQTDVQESSTYGCAVGPYKVLVTAYHIPDATFISIRINGRNEYIPATVEVVDYESNLCLLKLEPKELTRPLVPIKFSTSFKKGAEVESYWFSYKGHILSGRGFIDRAEVAKSTRSYAQFLNYIVSNASQRTSSGQVYFHNKKAIGIACWSDEQEAGLICAEVINHFLADAAKGKYEGFPQPGFHASRLIDPARRRYLKMPESLQNGIYVSDVYNLGTGSDELRRADVILKINGTSIDAYGRFKHSKFGLISFRHLIASGKVGETINFELWRDGKKQQLKVKARNFRASEMLVPYYEYDKQPEYVIIGGFILQKLTRDYLSARGEDWAGKADPHIYHYYRDLAYKPADERKDIVVLSYVLPAVVNLGYHGLSSIVVSKFNGKDITSIKDIIEAMQLNSDSKYHVIQFEHDNPVVVIPRENLDKIDAQIAQQYGIQKLIHIEP
jgi:S1-C subfamily serine protease